MTEKITIEPLDPTKHEDLIMRAHAANFDGRESAAKRASYARWLTSNPVEGSIYLAAYVDGAFASFLGFMAREVVGFDRTLRGALAFAASTLAEFRGRGLYRRLAHAGWEEGRRRGFDFAMGYTIRGYVLEMEMRMGWSSMGSAPVMVLPLDPVAIARAALPRFAAAAGLASPIRPLARWRARRRVTRQHSAEVSIAHIKEFPPDLDDLAATLRRLDRLTFAKDKRTLDWLYLSPDNPFDYDILEARQNGRLTGFAVGRRMDLMGLEGYGILDLIALPGCSEALRLMAARLVEIALAGDQGMIAALVSRDSEAHAALRELGFINSRQTFTFIHRAIAERPPERSREPANWAHFWGNADTI
jgi:hypothetical protein